MTNTHSPARATRVGALLVVGAAALGLTACNATSLDTPKLEKALKKSVEDAGLGATVGDATCPKSKEIKIEAGGTFECSVDVDGRALHFTVTQKDKKGNVEWAKKDALIDLRKVEGEVASGLKKQTGVEAEVSCGDEKVRATVVGETFDCTAKAASDGSTAKISVKAKDADGNVDWKLQQ